MKAKVKYIHQINKLHKTTNNHIKMTSSKNMGCGPRKGDTLQTQKYGFVLIT